MRQLSTTDKAQVQIRLILELADRMIVLSDKGLESCDDDGCLVLNGMVREYADRLRNAAEREREIHLTSGHRDATPAAARLGRHNAR